jgi:hypothetical protein
MATVIKSISVSLEFNDLAEAHEISWSEAARIGMSLLLAEKGERDYDNNLNLYRKMQFFKTELEKINFKLEENAKL